VGVTRAKQKLYLVSAFRRSLMGRSTAGQPSRFLDDIPKHLIASGGFWREEENSIADSIYSWNKPDNHSSSNIDLKAGDHVHHAQFGNGVVVSYQTIKDDAEVVVAFNGGVKKLLLSFANLELKEQ
jgi:DNA helicase-2/ATP-dependent DNA helicase PcrA